ncbi:MAG: FAD-dependent oxidoreductase [Armatimonadetes bacterium]|nr:FAD-dependent oxidoreductase [Armatimonadota bacterium]
MFPDLECDILIVGGGTGACAAAMAATDMGFRVIMTEETIWLGGQLTSQAVPPDEHPWIETHGCTRRYRKFRNDVRAYYRQFHPLTTSARRWENLNPGNGWVSRTCLEPRVAVAVLDQMLANAIGTGQLQIFYETVPTSATTGADRVDSVTVLHKKEGATRTIRAKFVLDATELGDLLPMTGTEYRVGSESRSEFGELHALEEANPDDIQGFTWCMAVGFKPGSNNVIEKPAQYEFWRNYSPAITPPWPGKLFSWDVVDAISMERRTFSLFGDWGLFTYRRIVDGSLLETENPVDDVSIINWVQNDHFFKVIDQPEEMVDETYENAKQQSLSLLYWLQTEAERHDGGFGYPELYLCPSAVGTATGLAMAPYHRESRRIRAQKTVTEAHIGVEMRGELGGPEKFTDSVGVGAYRIDLHPSAGGRNSVDLAAYPFQIPLGSLVPERIKNLLPACKNIGVTHITNGCYRLHPVEWNIGESSALLAGFCIKNQLTPQEVTASDELVKEFQRLCVAQGIELDWPTIRPL